MFSRILVGYQDTEQGRDALELGRVLAQRRLRTPRRGELSRSEAPVALVH